MNRPKINGPTGLRTSKTVSQILPALVKAQAAVREVTKNSYNKYHNSHFADLPAIIEATRGPLADNGLAILQFPAGCDDQFGMLVYIIHQSGEFLEHKFTVNLPPELRGNAQRLGGFVTYMRRYVTAAVLAVPTVDDDGETAMGRGAGAPANAVPPTKPKTPPPASTEIRSVHSYITTMEEQKLMSEISRYGLDSHIDRLHAWCGRTWGVDEFKDLTVNQYYKLLEKLPEFSKAVQR